MIKIKPSKSLYVTTLSHVHQKKISKITEVESIILGAKYDVDSHQTKNNLKVEQSKLQS